MSSISVKTSNISWLHRLVAFGGVALVLALGVFSASPRLHEWLHPDADQPGHVCAITLFQHGLVQTATAVILLEAAVRWIARLDVLPAGPDLIARRFRLCPGRAPPGR